MFSKHKSAEQFIKCLMYSITFLLILFSIVTIYINLKAKTAVTGKSFIFLLLYFINICKYVKHEFKEKIKKLSNQTQVSAQSLY